jgi:GNAT superfamily N-acetyltransferase
MRELRFRDARPDEIAGLEALQLRASLIWDSDRPHLLAHPDAIELPASLVAEGLVRVVERDAVVLGFSALTRVDAVTHDLEALFVEPAEMRAGIGAALLTDAAALARQRGAQVLTVTANPNALAFYLRNQFVSRGTVATRFGPGIAMVRELLTPPAAPPG